MSAGHQHVEFLYNYRYGLLDLEWWQLVIIGLLWAHITLMAITLWFHRDQAHRSIDLHPALAHFFRLWLWMSTGAPTAEWVAVHRKHHALCEVEGDPHSPQIYGLKHVLLEGAELYKEEAHKKETVEKYGKGTPTDWLERKVYTGMPNLGITLLVVLDLVLFGAPGVILLATQLLTMPALAAGVINGLCHARGYRNFETNDASTNLWRIGLFVGGEELHNNHHAFPTSARFSMRPGEIDMGWLHIKFLSWFGLAKVRRIAEPPQLEADEKSTIDLDSLRAIFINRMYVLRHYLQEVTLPALEREAAQGNESQPNSVLSSAARLLRWQPHLLDEESRDRLGDLIEGHPGLQSVLEYRNELKSFWEGAHTSNERLLTDFRAWCARAEASGIQGMQDFVAYLRSFRAMPEPAAAT